jgi:endonuclease III
VSDVASVIVPGLHEFYGAVHRPPPDLFPFIVWEVLSDRTAPGRRDLAWTALRKIPALTPDAMFRAPVKDLGDAVGLTGVSREDTLTRLRSIVETFKRRRDALDDARVRHTSLLQAARALRAITQVDANVQRRALLFVTDLDVLPVDDDVARLIQRLTSAVDLTAPLRGVASHTPGALRRQARRWLTEQLPSGHEARRDAVTYLRHHARQTCVAVGPHCAICPLARSCATGVVARSRSVS